MSIRCIFVNALITFMYLKYQYLESQCVLGSRFTILQPLLCVIHDMNEFWQRKSASFSGDRFLLMGSRHFTTELTRIYRCHILLRTVISNLFTSITEAKGTRAFLSRLIPPFLSSLLFLSWQSLFFQTAIGSRMHNSAPYTNFFASILYYVSS